MGFENPITSSLVARLDDPKLNLAAFGVAFALGLVIESPVINILSAVASLCKDRTSYLISRNFAYGLNVLIVAIHLFVLIPPVYDVLSISMIGLEPKVAELTYEALWYLILWPPMIGVRRFYQGVMVAHGQTKMIAVATAMRLLTVLSLAMVFIWFDILSGASAATLTLSVAVTVEAAFVYFSSLKSCKHFLAIDVSDETPSLTTKSFAKYYFPLAQTSFIGLAFMPMLTFFMARSVNALDALAAFPIANSFAFIFRTVGLSVTEVLLVFFKKGEKYYHVLRKITNKLVLVTTVIYVLIALTPIIDFLLISVVGVSEDLSSIIKRAIIVLTPIVAGSIILSYYRAQAMIWSRTVHLSRGTIIEVSTALVIVWLGIDVFKLDGAVSAAAAISLSRMIQIIFIYSVLKKEGNLYSAKMFKLSSYFG